jgi:hypothetical protein
MQQSQIKTAQIFLTTIELEKISLCTNYYFTLLTTTAFSPRKKHKAKECGGGGRILLNFYKQKKGKIFKI